MHIMCHHPESYLYEVKMNHCKTLLQLKPFSKLFHLYCFQYPRATGIKSHTYSLIYYLQEFLQSTPLHNE